MKLVPRTAATWYHTLVCIPGAESTSAVCDEAELTTNAEVIAASAAGLVQRIAFEIAARRVLFEDDVLLAGWRVARRVQAGKAHPGLHRQIGRFEGGESGTCTKLLVPSKLNAIPSRPVTVAVAPP